jgi:hypothetical protein
MMRVVVVAGGQWFREGAVVIDVKHGVIARNGHSVVFPRRRNPKAGVSNAFRYVSYIVAAFPRTVSNAAVAELLWGDDPDGGPEGVGSIIGKWRFDANKAFAPLGLRFIGTYQAGGGGRVCEVLP